MNTNNNNNNNNSNTPPTSTDVSGWSIDQVASWASSKFSAQTVQKLRDQEVSGNSLLTLTYAELTSAPFNLPGGAAKEIVNFAVQLQSAQAQVPAGPSSTPGADLQASLSSIASYLHSIPLLCNIEGVLSLVHTFIPSTTHPFKASIIAAKVPATVRGGPDLLLHKLPITLPDIASLMDIDIINDEDEEGLRYPTKVVLQKMEEMKKMSWAMKVITLIGVSGCGKTRAIFEILSAKVGLYFVASNVGNGGSADMQAMQQQLESALKFTNDAEIVGSHFLNALLLSRLLVLDYLLSSLDWKTNARFAHFWLLLQYQPTLFLGEDVFRRVFEVVVKCGFVDISSKLQSTSKEIWGKLGTVFVFGDEAQVVLDSCVGQFMGDTHKIKERPLFSKLVNTWAALDGVVLLLAGTGLRLRKAMKLLASATHKSESDLQEFVVVDFGLYNTIEDLAEYLRQFFPTDSIPAGTLSNIMGRRRNAALYAAYVMKSTSVSNSLLVDCYNDMEEFTTGKQHQEDKTSLRHQFWQLATNRRPDLSEKATSVLNVIRHLAVVYYYFGTQYVFSDREALDLVERGICPMQRDAGGELITCIAEPLAAMTAYKFFLDIGAPLREGVLDLMSSSTFSPSSCGLFYEAYLVPAVIEYFTKGGVSLDQHPYIQANFKDDLKDLPWLIGASFKTPNIERASASKWVLTTNSSEKTKLFLANPGADVCRPDPASRKDAIAVVNTKHGERLAFMEWKLRKDVSLAVSRVAVQSTSFKTMYTTKSGRATNKRRRTEVNTIMEDKYSVSKGTLRIIFIYPYVHETITPDLEDNDVVVILDRHYSPDVLKPAVWQFLDAIKQGLVVNEKI